MSTTPSSRKHVHVKFRTVGSKGLNREDGLFVTNILALTITEAESEDWASPDAIDYQHSDGRLEVRAETSDLLTLPRRIEDVLASSGYQLTGQAFDALTAALSGSPPNPAAEWLHMRAEDLEVLKKLGLSVRGRDVRVEVTGATIDDMGGWRTVGFLAGPVPLEVYLDIRYERGGRYQFTARSKLALGLTDRD